MSAPRILSPTTLTGGTPVGGSGTLNTIPRWTGASTLGDSGLIDNGTAIYTTTRNVGIGTASPSSFGGYTSLTVYNATNGGLIESTNGTRTVRLQAQGSGTALVGTTTGHDFSIMSNAVARISVIGSGATEGNVGIGTASPLARLAISTTGNVNAPTLGSATGTPLLISNSNTTFGLVAGTNGADGHAWLQAQRTDGPTTTYNLTLNEAGGNVGIGTASPGYKLDVNGSVNVQQQLYINSGNQGFITWGGGAANTLNIVGGSGKAISLGTNGGYDKLFVDTSGNVGIGTTSPATTFTRNLTVYGSSSGGVTFQNSSIHYGIAANASLLQIYDITNSAERGRFTSTSFDISATSGYGLKLPATPGNADTQTLDCYAEGTWTPTLTGFGGTNPTLTARYVRVGKLVTLSVLVSATGGATFSSTATTTYISLPAGMTPTVCSQPGVTSNSGIVADGPCVAYTNGNLYLPTFALRNADTFLNLTYML